MCCLLKAATRGPKVLNMDRSVRSIPGPAIAVLMPTRGRITIETVAALSNFDGIAHFNLPVSRQPVTLARNALARSALTLPSVAGINPKGGWYCLWVDDDAFWRPGTVATLMRALHDNPQIDILAGWFSGRSGMSNPKACWSDGTWPRPSQEGGNCAFGDIVEVDSVGFHFVLHRIDVLSRMGNEPFSDPSDSGTRTEDAQFCANAKVAGLRVYVHTGVPVAHVDDDGFAYLPGEPRMRVVGEQLVKVDEEYRSYGADVDRVVNAAQSGLKINIDLAGGR